MRSSGETLACKVAWCSVYVCILYTVSFDKLVNAIPAWSRRYKPTYADVSDNHEMYPPPVNKKRKNYILHAYLLCNLYRIYISQFMFVQKKKVLYFRCIIILYLPNGIKSWMISMCLHSLGNVRWNTCSLLGFAKKRYIIKWK